MRNWLEPPEPPEYPKCMSCGSTNYEKAYVKGNDVFACSDCCIEYDADELVEVMDENARDNYEDEQYEHFRERMFFDGT